MNANAGLQQWPAASLTFPFASNSSRLPISVAYCPVSTAQRFQSCMNTTQIPLDTNSPFPGHPEAPWLCERGHRAGLAAAEASAEVSNK